MATATAPAITRAILEDRWRGAIDGLDGDLFSKDGLRLIDVLDRLIVKVTRNPATGALIGGLHPIDELVEAVHVRLIQMIDPMTESESRLMDGNR